MSRGQWTFRPRDLTRALLAAEKAGTPVKQINIENGKFTLVVGEPDEPNAGNGEKNEWDEVFDGAIKTAIR
jgi:hypothetical protein